MKFSGYIPSSIMDELIVPAFLNRFRQLRELVKPISSFTRPSTFGEATARIKHNLSYFHSTYAMFVLSIIYFSFLLHPYIMLSLASVYSAFILLYLGLKGSVEVFNWTVDERMFLSYHWIVVVLFLLYYGLWLNVLVSILIGFAIVVIHAAFRGTEDLHSDLQEVDGDEELHSDLQEVDGNEDLLSDSPEVDGNEDLLPDLEEDDDGIPLLSVFGSQP